MKAFFRFTLGLLILSFSIASSATGKVKCEPMSVGVLSRSMKQFESRITNEDLVVFAQTEPLSGKDETTFYNYWPTVFIKNKSQAWQIQFKEFLGHMWVHGAVFRKGKFFVGVLEHTIEGPTQELPLALSKDGGKTWEVSFLKKPSYLAEFQSLAINNRGVGFITLKIDDSGGDKLKGEYIYKTTNWGKTWSKPDFHRDNSRPVTSESCSFGMQPTPVIKPPCRLSEDFFEFLNTKAR